MKTFKQFMAESNQTKLRTFLRRDQSQKEIANRDNIHKEVLSHYSDDKVGNKRLEKSIKTDSNATWTLAQHMEHHPKFQKRVLSHLEKGHNEGDKQRANFLKDRMDVNAHIKKNHPENFDNVRNGNKKWDNQSKSYVDRKEKDVLPGHKDWKPPTSPEEAHKRISDPNHPEHSPHLAAAIDAVKKTRPKGYRFTQPSFAVNGNEWFKDNK
jgi:hypothetical protein